MRGMHLIEIFLPVADNQGQSFGHDVYERVKNELSGAFGGITAFTRPGHGETREGGHVVRDDIIVFEIMSERLDKKWWAAYRKKLETIFKQDEILIRSSEISRL